MAQKLNIVFFGTPEFSVPAMDMLHNHPMVNLKYVVTMPDRPAGRGQKLQSPPVALYAKEHKIPLIQTENINKEEAFIENLKAEQIDMFVVLAFSQFLSTNVLDIPKVGPYNIHTSLLPKYRGAAPIQYALLNGDTYTGVSIQRMVQKMDAGNIVYSNEVSISPSENGGQLFTRLKFLAALGLNDFIENYLSGNYNEEVQDESKVSYAPTLKKEMGLLSFSNHNSDEILNRIRAFDPWPGTYFFLEGKRIKVLNASISSLKLPPGNLLINEKGIFAGTKTQAIQFQQLQIEGKKPENDTDFKNRLKNMFPQQTSWELQ